MNSNLVESTQSLANIRSCVSRIPPDVLGLIFDEATYDATWDGYPPPPSAYSGSPLETAVVISQVCTNWRGEISGRGCIWGRLLNTSFFPTYNNALWKQVYRRSGETSPIWLRHVDTIASITDGATRLTQRQIYRFVHMFLLVVHNVPVHRIRRLELNVWHREFLCNLPASTRMKIREAAARHVKHLKLGNADLNRGGSPSGEYSQDTHADMALVRREHAQATSSMLLDLFFGDTISRTVHSSARPLLKLEICGVAVQIEDLLSILRSMPLLEELHLIGGAAFSGAALSDSLRSVPENSPPSPSDIVHLPRLRTVRVLGMSRMNMMLIRRIRLCPVNVCCVDSESDNQGESEWTNILKHNCCVQLGRPRLLFGELYWRLSSSQ